jgi:sugar O-acyltransferase (sialic acid O-acetyltransferase NeuD family)
VDNYIILGVGKYIANIEEILESIYEKESSSTRDYKILGFIDSDTEKKGKNYYGYEVVGDINWFETNQLKVNVISFINPIGRQEIFSNLPKNDLIHFPNLIHSSAIISKKAEIGIGNIIAQGAVIAPYAKIGNHNHLNYSVIVGHHCQIDNYTTLNGGAHVAGSSHIKEAAFIGPGAVVIDNITIGERSKIGANAVVRKDVPNDVTAVGVPAKIL